LVSVRAGGADLFVPAAAGGVGTAIGRFARLLSAGRLMGSAGSAAKADHLMREVGYDAVFDYHNGPAAALSAKAAPDGINVFVDNVSGRQLAAASGTSSTYPMPVPTDAVAPLASVYPLSAKTASAPA
jgi:NADPH-dependent curcumin reductase CurA